MRKGIRRRRRDRGGTRIRGTEERQNAGPCVHSAAGRFLREIGPHRESSRYEVGSNDNACSRAPPGRCIFLEDFSPISGKLERGTDRADKCS
jgi:hypothetical protein